MKKECLGIKSSPSLKKALFCKWNWRFSFERDALWIQVIRGKHDEESRESCSWEVREDHRFKSWKETRKEWELIKSRIAFFMRSGTRIKLRKDRQCRAVLYVRCSL